jgi:hypothetical protein
VGIGATVITGKIPIQKYTKSVDIDLDYVGNSGRRQEYPKAAYRQIRLDR